MADFDQEYLKSILDYSPETGQFTWLVGKHRGKIAGSKHRKGYTLISISGKKYRANRLAVLYMLGKWPQGIVDHENRKRDDDRFDNLRDTSYSVNNHNSELRADNTSGHKGVHWFKNANRWRASISIDKKLITLGWFADKEQAIKARKTAEIEYGRN